MPLFPSLAKKQQIACSCLFLNQRIELMTQSTNPKPRNRLEHGGKKEKMGLGVGMSTSSPGMIDTDKKNDARVVNNWQLVTC